MNIINSIANAVYGGIKDYHIDTKHDRLLRQVQKIGCKMYAPMSFYNSETRKKARRWYETYPWKEGSLFHYIGQRYYFYRVYNKAEI